jgi:hypothetical protein
MQSQRMTDLKSFETMSIGALKKELSERVQRRFLEMCHRVVDIDEFQLFSFAIWY